MYLGFYEKNDGFFLKMIRSVIQYNFVKVAVR